MKADESFDPLDVGLFSARAVGVQPHGLSDLVEQFGAFGNRAKEAVHLVAFLAYLPSRCQEIGDKLSYNSCWTAFACTHRVKDYDTVAEEIRSGCIDPGCWARAMSEAEGDKRKAEAAYIRIRAVRVARTRFTKIVAFALASLVILSAVAGGIVLARDWLDARRLHSLESHLRSVPLTPPKLIKGNVVPVLEGIQPWQLEWDHDGKTPLPPYWSQVDSALADQDNPSALFNMAVRYARGDGLALDPHKALQYCRRSAALDYEPAKRALKTAGL